MASNITLEPGGPRPPSLQEQQHIRDALGVPSSDALDSVSAAVGVLESNSATVAALGATNDIVDSLVAAKDLELMDESRIYEVGEAFHYDGRNWRCDVQAAIAETPDTNPEKFSEIGSTPTGPVIKALYEVEPNAFTDALFTKLGTIDENATDDQTGIEIKTLYELEPNAFTDAQFIKLAAIEELADVTDSVNVAASGAVMYADTDVTGMGFGINEDTMVSNSSTLFPTQSSVKAYVDSRITQEKSYKGGYDATANVPNLDNPPLAVSVSKGDVWDVTTPGLFYSTTELQVGDTVRAVIDDPVLEEDWVVVQGNLTPASIKSQYESNADTNEFLDAEKAKLAGIEPGATADLSAGEIKTLYESNLDTNPFTGYWRSKLRDIEFLATADQTGPEIKALYELESKAFTDSLYDDLVVISADSHTHANKAVLDNTEVAYTLLEATKLATVEENADETDASNVVIALTDANPTDITPAGPDEILIKDSDDTGSLKVLTLDNLSTYLGIASGGTSQAVDANFDIQASDENTTQDGSVAGAVRGEYSVDLQTIRNDAAMVASGSSSTIIGGAYNRASGIFSTASGLYAVADLFGHFAIAGGQHANPGDSQYSTYLLRNTTSDGATTTRLSFDANPAAHIVIPPEFTASYSIKVVAYNSTDNLGAAWNVRCAIRRDNANSTVLLGNVVEETFTEGVMSNCVVAVTADDVNEALDISVNGLAGKDIKWTAAVEAAEVGDTAR